MSSSAAVFVYGSLMCGEVLENLLGRIPVRSYARLNGFHRYRLQGETYPAIYPKENSFVEGIILKGISNSEISLLDKFEDVEYNRVVVKVQPKVFEGSEGSEEEEESNLKGEIIIDEISAGEKEKEIEAFVYVLAEFSERLYGTWKYNEHFYPAKAPFLKMCEEFMTEFRAANSGRSSNPAG